eukprot:TRINITY_DN64811_c0_g1_i1.p1 TRINITY_DN64811_c0_g1~~TRINITY_DN64811_c0_g1_i1.p1  ORF type:complete len:242 (+),score=69.75 TRINITY_DN64811_c0_g1_i1:119-844(+)
MPAQAILATAPSSNTASFGFETNRPVPPPAGPPMLPTQLLLEAAMSAAAAASVAGMSASERSQDIFFSTEEVRVPYGNSGEDVAISVPRYHGGKAASKTSGIPRAPPGLEAMAPEKPRPAVPKTAAKPPGLHLPMKPNLKPPPGLLGFDTSCESLSLPPPPPFSPSEARSWPASNEEAARIFDAGRNLFLADEASASLSTPLPSLLGSAPRYFPQTDLKMKPTPPTSKEMELLMRAAAISL